MVLVQIMTSRISLGDFYVNQPFIFRGVYVGNDALYMRCMIFRLAVFVQKHVVQGWVSNQD